MSSIQESIFNAVDIITEKKISEIKFDKTIECIIVQDAKADSGEYTVQFQDIMMPVFSSNNTVKYKTNDNVYVLIPQGDMSNKKTIIGRKDTRGEEFLDIESMIDKIQKLGDNYVDEPEGSSFSFNSGSNQIRELAFRSEEFIIDYKNKLNLLFGANIVTDLLNENGDFGLELDLTYVSGVRHTYRMSMNSMTGNPYALENQYQYKVFPLLLDDVQMVNGMFLYIDGFPTAKENAVTFTNVEVVFAKPREIEGLDQFSANLFAPKGTVFKNGILNPDDSLDLEMKILKVGKEIKPGASYKWFFMDSTVSTPDVNNGWDVDGGLGWRIINIEENNYGETISISEDGKTLTVYADFIPNFETFKCVAAFGGETIEFPDETTQSFGVIKLESIETITDQTDAVNIVITSSKGDVFKVGDGVVSTDLICKVVFGTDIIEPNKFLYSWSELNSDGSVTPIKTLQDSEILTIDVESDILNIENYICEVFIKE